ncbi:MAG: YIP1 family protein [Rhodobacteraceae bacterium]|jgi:hypothetical protein|nr:YIP1 family protein [Paracoccaceae bacterium]
MNRSTIAQLIRLSLQQPRAGLRAVLALDLPQGAGLAALALMAVASSLMLHLTLSLLPDDEQVVIAALFGSPVYTAVMQFVVLFLSVVVIHILGRGAGGRGRFDQGLVTMAWLQFLMLVLQAVQILVLLALPPLAGLVGLAAMVLFLWLLTGFVAELHGFVSQTKVFFAIIGTMILLALALSTILMTVLGPEAMTNV